MKKKYVLTFFTWTPYPEYLANQELIKKFNKKYPKITVRQINDASTRAMDKLQTMIASGTAPDVMSIHGAFYVPFAAKNTLSELDKFIQSDEEFNLSDFYPVLINSCKYNDKLYSLPRYTSVYVLFYNKQLFDEVKLKYPNDKWTWDDYLSAAVKLTKDTNNDNVVDQYGCVIDFWGARLYPWIWQNNGELFNKDKTRCLIDQPAVVEAVQFLVDLQYKYKVTPRTLPHEYKNNVEMFSVGKIGMFISGAWDIQNLKGTQSFQWDIAPLPRKKRHATILGTENYAISSTTKHPEEAWLFYKFLLSPESQTYMADKLEKQPALISVAKEFVTTNTGYDRNVLVNALDYAVPAPNLPQWAEISHYYQDELDLIWVGKKTVPAGLKSAVENINKNLVK